MGPFLEGSASVDVGRMITVDDGGKKRICSGGFANKSRALRSRSISRKRGRASGMELSLSARCTRLTPVVGTLWTACCILKHGGS